jgi:hypothetical protein
MPRTRKDEATQFADTPIYQARTTELGDYTVSFETFPEDADGAPVFVGLPDDRCQCHHFGYVIAGRFTVQYADRVEVYNAGDAFLTRPGHTPSVEAGTEVVSFTKTTEARQTMDILGANMAAMSASLS